MKLFLAILFFGSLVSCRPSVSTGDLDDIRAEISALDSDQKKSAFLANLRAADQEERSESTQIPVDQRFKKDLYRIEQVGAYMQQYGYPSRANLGDDAADAPLLIIHHAPYDAARYKYFDYIYQGYLNDDIDADGLAFFLGRFQNNVNGQWITFDRPFTVEEEIDTLISALKLEPRVVALTELNKPNS